MLPAFTSQAGDPQPIAFYEWIDPNTEQGHGAFPFRTGISTMGIMVTGFLFKVMREYSPSSSSLQQFLDDTSRKNYLRGKQCSLTELLGNILFYFIFALLLLGFF
jgi:hypothetical protein